MMEQGGEAQLLMGICGQHLLSLGFLEPQVTLLGPVEPEHLKRDGVAFTCKALV